MKSKNIFKGKNCSTDNSQCVSVICGTKILRRWSTPVGRNDYIHIYLMSIQVYPNLGSINQTKPQNLYKSIFHFHPYAFCCGFCFFCFFLYYLLSDLPFYVGWHALTLNKEIKQIYCVLNNPLYVGVEKYKKNVSYFIVLKLSALIYLYICTSVWL